jgi:hypothetical protein
MLFVSACVFIGGVMTFVVLGYLTRRRETHRPADAGSRATAV